MSATDCVGFVDCPCKGCRARRLAAHDEHHSTGHPDPFDLPAVDYCAACRQKRDEPYRLPQYR